MIGTDLGLYVDSGASETIIVSAQPEMRMASAPLSEPGVSGIHVLANKVVKFMLTSRNSFCLDKNYGSKLPTYTQMSRHFIPRVHMEVSEDLRRCAQFIKKHEHGLPPGAVKLSSLRLNQIYYNEVETPFRIDVYITITTTDGQRALLNIKKSGAPQ
jgi:hypothetical protein